jgi:hypothetical protein
VLASGGLSEARAPAKSHTEPACADETKPLGGAQLTLCVLMAPPSSVYVIMSVSAVASPTRSTRTAHSTARARDEP